MMRSISLFICATLFTTPVIAVDCSLARPWVKTVYPDSNTQVHKDNKLYTNQYWAPVTAVPGESTIWVAKGACDAGTAGNGPTVDCSALAAYENKEYLSNIRVQHQGHGFESRWYVNKNQAPLSNEVWLELGVCGSGVVVPGATTTAPPSAVTTTRVSGVSTTTRGNNVATTTTTGGSTGTSSWPRKFFAPWMDATLAKRPSFSSVMSQTGTRYFSMGFIVSAHNTCVPTWGTYYSVSQGPWSSFMTEVNQLRAQGGDIIVSFGGASNVELANAAACQSGDAVSNLKKAYLEVIDAYGLTWIDFDIEGEYVSEAFRNTAWKYRFEAVDAILAERPNLQVSYTLPVLPSGLLANAQTFIGDMMSKTRRFTAVNIMAMNYGTYNCPGDMGGCEIDAVKSLASQLYQAASNAGKLSTYGWSSVADVYPYIGSTAMIGVNDVQPLQFSLANARSVISTYQSSLPIRWASFWSLARDSPCASTWAQGDCSGASVQTKDLEFTSIYAPYTA